MNQKLVNDANRLAIGIGQKLIRLQALHESQEPLDHEQSDGLWVDVRRMIGQLHGMIYAAQLLLPAEDFAVFVQQSGIGTDSVTDAISSFARSLSDGN